MTARRWFRDLVAEWSLATFQSRCRWFEHGIMADGGCQGLLNWVEALLAEGLFDRQQPRHSGVVQRRINKIWPA